jgi:hypothetical protein
LIPTTAAAKLNISLAPFGITDINNPERDVAGFKSLVGDLGSILGPRSLGPAHTTGALGFDIGVDFSVSAINNESAHWNKVFSASPDSQDDPPQVLSTVQLKMRKGLPYSFELGGGVSKLLDSDLWAMGLSLRYALLEGYRLLPDVAVRTGVRTVLGSREMSVLLTGGDLTISKSFGVGGIMSLAPYISYNLLIARASSYVVGRFASGTPVLDKFVFNSQTVLRHRGAIGVRMISNHISVSLEALLTRGVQTFTSQLGATF